MIMFFTGMLFIAIAGYVSASLWISNDLFMAVMYGLCISGLGGLFIFAGLVK